MVRKTLLGTVALGTLAVLAAASWLATLDDARTVQAGTAGVLAAVAPRERIPDVAPPEVPQRVLSSMVLEALDRAVTPARERAISAGELSPEDAKEVAKLQKKLNKAAKKQAKLQLKLANLNDALLAAQSALDDATSDGSAKLVAKLTKKLAKLQAKMDKTQAKLDALEGGIDVLVGQIVVLDPDHFVGIAGLQAPEEMQVVTADEGAGAGAGGQGVWEGGSSVLDGGDFPQLSDFNLDPVHSHVFDPSMEVLSTVDMILCFMSGTAYDAMVNQGLYVAQVDEGNCEAGSEDGGDQGQSSGAGAEQPSLFTVKCQRAAEGAEQVVSLWVPMGGPGESAEKQNVFVRVKMTVFEGVTENDPYGRFKLDFAGVPPGGALNDPIMHGTLMTLDVQDGFLGFSFHSDEGDLFADPFPPDSHAEVVQANVNMFDDQSQGVARIHRQFRENHGDGDTGVQTEEYLLAFDADSVLRGTTGLDTQCLSRTEFDTQVFRYSLYEAGGENPGARVERDAGFNIKTADGAFGWAGYYGLWLPPEVADDLHTGDTVTKAVWGDDDAEPEAYTVLMAPGKLIRNSRQELALADADGESFEWFEFPMMPPPGEPGDPPPPPPMPTHWRVTYHADPGVFLKDATFDDSTGTWSDVLEPQPINLNLNPFLQMFSQSLGGSVSFVAGDDHMTYFQQTFVTSADAIFGESDEVPLFGYFDCLEGNISEADAESGSIFQDNSFDVESPHRYMLHRSDMALYLDEEGDQTNLVPCALADGAQPEGGPFQWGMRTGPLLTDTSGLESTFQLWNYDTFYTWETGANSWNKLTMLLDSEDAAVVFDPPLQFTYEHSAENDANGDPTYAGKKYLLQYNGPGDLFGVPMSPFDLDGDGSPDRWYPQFSIADGVLMGPQGVEYVVKAIEKELNLQDANGSLCAGQTVGPVADLPLPDGSEYDAPDIGPKPVTDEPPAVVDGVVQTPPSNP